MDRIRIRCKSPISSVHECLHTACTGMQRMHRLDIDISDEGTDKKMALLIFILICFLRLRSLLICPVTVGWVRGIILWERRR